MIKSTKNHLTINDETTGEINSDLMYVLDPRLRGTL
jgi:hypothetical protein